MTPNIWTWNVLKTALCSSSSPSHTEEEHWRRPGADRTKLQRLPFLHPE